MRPWSRGPLTVKVPGGDTSSRVTLDLVQVRIDRDGRVLIPAAARDQLSLLPGADLELDVDDGSIVLTPVRVSERTIVDVGGVPALSPVAGAEVTDDDVARWRRADQR